MRFVLCVFRVSMSRISAAGEFPLEVAQDETELSQMLDQFETPLNSQQITAEASPELIHNLRQFITQAIRNPRGSLRC